MFKRATAVVAVFIAVLSMAFGFGATAAQAAITNHSADYVLSCQGTTWRFSVHYHHESSNSGEQAYAEFVTRLSGPRQLTQLWFSDAGPTTPVQFTTRLYWSNPTGQDDDPGHAFTGGWWSTGRAWWSLGLDNGTGCSAGSDGSLLYGTA